MVSLFLLLGCNLSYIVDLFDGLHELASASARTLLKLATSVHTLLKPYGDVYLKADFLNHITLCTKYVQTRLRRGDIVPKTVIYMYIVKIQNSHSSGLVVTK